MNNKELYKLWWEYLKRSNAYREFCLIANQKKLCMESIPIPTQRKIFNHFTGKRKNEFETKHHIYISDFIDIYKFWSDVYKNDFEYWWENKGNREDLMSKSAIADIRKDLKMQTHIADMSMRYCLNKKNKKMFSLEDIAELISLFRNYLSSPDNQQYLFLKVDAFSKASSDEISREIARLKTLQKRKLKLTIHSTRVHDELKKYLMVYDEKQQDQKIKWSDIILKIGSRVDKDKHKYENVLREYKRYYQKANKIIKNTEKNQFPGKY